MHTPAILRLIAVAGFVAAWISPTLAENSDSLKRTLRIGYQKSSTLAVVLKANGALERALRPLGVALSWHEFTSGLPLLEAVNTGSVDLSADVADTVPLFAQAAGARLAYVAEEAPSPAAQAIVVPAESGISTIADLKGRKVAVTKGAGSHFLLLAALAKGGLTFREISPAYLSPGDGRAAFVAGKVDAWAVWDPFLSSVARQSGAKVLLDGRDGLASYKRYYLASAAYAQGNDDVLGAVFAALGATGKWVKEHPQDAADLLAGVWSIDRDTVADANSHRSYQIGSVSRAGLAEQQKIADAFFSEGLIPVRVDAADARIWAPH